jgi:uncharacterized protein DUF6249
MNILPLALTGIEIGLTFGLAGMAFAAFFGFLGMFFHHRRAEQWHQTARLALEKGQPVPTPPPSDEDDESTPRSPRQLAADDLRSGLVLIAVGIGMFIFLSHFLVNSGLAAVGAIPGFIGLALLLYGGTRLLLSPKDDPSSSSAPRS